MSLGFAGRMEGRTRRIFSFMVRRCLRYYMSCWWWSCGGGARCCAPPDCISICLRERRKHASAVCALGLCSSGVECNLCVPPQLYAPLLCRPLSFIHRHRAKRHIPIACPPPAPLFVLAFATFWPLTFSSLKRLRNPAPPLRSLVSIAMKIILKNGARCVGHCTTPAPARGTFDRLGENCDLHSYKLSIH